MDAKEAIEQFNKYKNAGFNNYAQPKGEAIMLAFEALEKVETLEAENARLREKETPQKPKEKPQGGIIKCPVCGEFINWYAHFCWNCGQAIKNDKE